MFSHFIYRVEGGSVESFDPLRDLLVDWGTYLTWRRVDQDTPAGRSRLYGAVYRTYEPANAWNVVRFDSRGEFPSVAAWIQGQGKNFPGQKLGLYDRSPCYGLFFGIIAPTRIERSRMYREKVEQLVAFTAEVQLPRPFDFEPNPLNPVHAWGELRDEIISQLIELNRQAA